jgi:hypothetical protein
VQSFRNDSPQACVDRAKAARRLRRTGYGLSENSATLAEALARRDGASFQQAVNEELASLLENQVHPRG